MLSQGCVTWSSIEGAWNASPYVEVGAFEFESHDGRAWMYYHAPVPACVAFFAAAHAWLGETSFEGVVVQLVMDKAGSQIEVHTEDTAESRSALGQLYNRARNDCNFNP